MNTLIELIGQLNEISDLESEHFKSRAYKIAAVSLHKMSEEEFEARDDFEDLYGIGKSINAKILEFKQSGNIAKLQVLRAENADYLDPRYYKVRKGFVTRKITHEEATRLLENIIYNIHPGCNKFITVAGSYRREKDYIGDLDVLVPSNHYENFCGSLSTRFRVVSSGEYKTQFILDEQNFIPLDVISYDYPTFIYQLLYLTGSKETNIRMRKAAQSKGLILNQYGLWDSEDNNVLSSPGTENEVFQFLELEYLKPNER